MITTNNIETVINTVISYMKEENILLKQEDFEIIRQNKPSQKKHQVLVYQDKIVVYLPFRCGKFWVLIKKQSNSFLKYPNSRIQKNGILFTFTATNICNLQPTDRNLEKVIQKINKLLELSDKSKNNSEAEAINASLKAQKLLAKYNLDITDLSTDKAEQEICEVVADVGTGNKWKYDLAYIIAENYRCKCYCTDNNRITFYGYKADTIIARRIYLYLFKTGNTLANRYYQKKKKEKAVTVGIKNSYYKGFTKGIKSSLEKHSKELMLIVPKELLAAYQIHSKDFRKKDTRILAKNLEAYSQGIIEGQSALNSTYLEE